jgi:hypothetical protein
MVISTDHNIAIDLEQAVVWEKKTRQWPFLF